MPDGRRRGRAAGPGHTAGAVGGRSPGRRAVGGRSPGRRGDRVLLVALASAALAPLITLLARAFADTWRAPAVVPQAFGLRGLHYVLSGSAGVPQAILDGALIAALATAGALALGWSAARALGAASAGRRRLLLVALALPLLVPQYAIGTGLAEWFIRLGIADTIPGVAAAHLLYTLPYVIVVLAGAFDRELGELEEAAATMGAGPLRRMTLVSLPTARPALVSATMLALIVSWSQYGTTLAVGGGEARTLPLLLVPFAQSDPEIAAAIGLVFLAPALAALAIALRLGRAGERRAGR